MYEKTPFSAISSIFISDPSCYNTDRPASWVKYHKNISSYTCLRNIKKICKYFIFVVGYGLLPNALYMYNVSFESDVNFGEYEINKAYFVITNTKSH